MIFLSIGDKIKECRKVYNIKQTAFEQYGITQNYLSLIESGKRIPSFEVVKAIYRGFVRLTNQAITTKYSEFEFCQSQSEQANFYVLERLEASDWINECDALIQIAKEFELDNRCYQIYSELGEQYQKQQLYFKSNNYIQEAINYGLKINKSVANLYKLIGVNLDLSLNYEGSLMCYILAEQYAISEEEFILLQEIRCSKATTLLKLKQYDCAMECIEDVITSCEDLNLQGFAIRIKSKILIETEKLEEAKSLLNKFILETDIISHKVHSIYNLTCIYVRQKEYDNGLEMAYCLFQDEKIDKELKKKIIILITRIYFEKANYLKAQEFLKQNKYYIECEKNDQYFIIYCYEIAIEVYIVLDNEVKLTEILNELEKLTSYSTIKDSVIKLQNRVFNYLFKNKL